MKSPVKRFPIYQYLAMATGTLNIVNSGMHYGWPSPSLPQLLDSNSHIPTTNDEGSWIAVMVLLGAILGSVLAGLFLDRVGRKYLILFSSLPFLASWMMIAFARSVPVILAGRLMAGISDGLIFCAIPPYLGEIADPEIRGFLGASVSVAWILGILLMNVLGSFLPITTAALAAASLPALLLVTFCWMPESPYFLLMKNNHEGARRSLRIFKGTTDVDQELNRISKAITEQNENSSGSFLDLLTVESNRKALYIMMATRGGQQFSGTAAIMFYAQIIFKEAGDYISPTTGSIIYFGIQFVLSGVSTSIVDKSGRKPLLIISIIGSGLALFSEGCYFYIQNSTDIDISSFGLIPIVALISFVVMFSMGMQTVPVLLLGEVFPTNVKAVALSFIDIYYSVIATLVSKYFQITKDEFGMHVPFFTFSGTCALAFVFIILYVPETKGKTLEQIQEELKADKR